MVCSSARVRHPGFSNFASAEVASKVAIPVAGYETCSYGRVSFRDYIAARPVAFVQPDVAWAGGLTECLKIAHLAQAWNLPFAPHIHGSAMAVAAAAHLLGALPNGSMAEMVFPAHPLMADLVMEPLVVDSIGHIELNDRPGLGLEREARYLSEIEWLTMWERLRTGIRIVGDPSRGEPVGDHQVAGAGNVSIITFSGFRIRNRSVMVPPQPGCPGEAVLKDLRQA